MQTERQMLVLDAQWVSDDDHLDKVVEMCASAGAYSLDTEFHRERTYFPQLALVQVRVADQTFLIDPLSCDVGLFERAFRSDALCLVHAAQQDLEVLRQESGYIPSRIYDTQIAAGFLGLSSPSLASLVQMEAGEALPKGDRMSDWLRRPLTDSQRRYAALDVAYLALIHESQIRRLSDLGRVEWVETACEDLRCRDHGPPDPTTAWQRVKDVRAVKRTDRGVAMAVAEWRERRAAELDIPVRRVISDVALMAIVHAKPVTVDDLSSCRGLDARSLGRGGAEAVLAAVREGRERNVEAPESDHEPIDRRMRGVMPLLMAWIAEIARMNSIDPTLMGTRRDVVEFLSGGESARLRHGWRRQMVGEDLDRIVAGTAALAFQPDGSLRLVDSHAH